MMKAGKKRTYIARNAKSPIGLKELEEKAIIFYKLALVKDRRYLFRTYRSTFVGKEMVDSMVVSGLVSSRLEAVELGRDLAEKVNLFQNCENCMLKNRRSLFEDDPTKFYRFSSGALMVIRNLDENDKKIKQPVTPAPSTSYIPPASINNSPSHGPSMERQNGSNKVQSDKIETKIEENTDDKIDAVGTSSFKQKKKSISRSIYVPPMESIVEETNEDESSLGSSKASKSTITRKEKERLREIQILASEQARFEIEAFEQKMSKEEKAHLERARIERIKFLAHEQLVLHTTKRRKSTAAHCIMEAINNGEHGDDNIMLMDAKERTMANIVSQLQKRHSENWIAKYGSLMNEVDSKVATVYTGDHHIVETKSVNTDASNEKKKDDGGDTLVTKFETQDNEVVAFDEGEKEEPMYLSEKGMKWKKQLEARRAAKNGAPPKQKAANENMKYSVSKVREQDMKLIEEEESKEPEKPIFVTSPKDLPAGLRRRISDFTINHDSFDSILNKKTGNLLTMGNDDDQSVWTEFIIGDEKGRELYRRNEIKRRRPSYVSYVEESVVSRDDKSVMEYTIVGDETLYDEETICDEETVISNWQPSIAPAPVAKHSSDDQSYMDFTIFDNSVAISYIEDDVDYIAPDRPQKEKREPEEGEHSILHIFANRNSKIDDDDMTQITMDYALMFQQGRDRDLLCQKMKDSQRVPVHAIATKKPTVVGGDSTTSRKRIREILWNDLYSCNRVTVSLALETLRSIIESESESRKNVVRMGGIVAILGTMEEYFEEEAIQYLSCVIIELLASVEPEARKIINEMRGIQVIARSMQDQADSNRVQEAGRVALATICRP
ncbi:unnamed protein product [Pseudo-nitzschia multistriata]|uniref:DEP domain-containing protein n=1 Tax=Pseudo-nitzschia multistriata TaxID=183589 RepID=A0A448ZMQ9_9STRA|nr:unnamed protein product [Pseudo-nitzschia multistriata]